MNRHTDAGDASVRLLCATFGLSRAAFYAEKRRQRGDVPPRDKSTKDNVVPLPRRPRYTAAEVVLERIREVLARHTARAWGVRKVWATLKREGLKVSRRRVHALMRAHGLVLVRDSEPGEPARGHVTVPEPNRRIATDLTTVWTRKDGVVALVPTIDCGDRTAVITVTKDQHGPAVLASVEAKLVEAFGSPDNVPDDLELRTDHGSQYTGNDCAKFCGSCPYSCVEATFLGGKQRRESFRVANTEELSREATNTITSTRRYRLRDPDARRLPVRSHRACA